jgi:predicted dehydrogenase
MSQPRKLKLAQVGVDHFGAYRRDRLRETGLFELVACYDWNAEAMKKAEQQDGARPTASYEELLATPGIEGMVISTGAKFHAEQALAAQARGLHVFVEKPLCATAAEMHALLAAQRRTGLVVGVGHNDHSHDPHSAAIQRLITSGELGTIAAFDATTCHNGGMMIKPGDWRGDPAKNPGGMLFQCGVHKLHELLYYFGPVSGVSCHLRYDANPNTGTADTAHCILRFASGLLGTLNAYHVSPYYHTLNVFGTRSNLYVNHRFFSEGTLMFRQTSHLDGKQEPLVPVAPEGTEDRCGNVKSWYQAIVAGGTCYPSLVDGARAVAVVFAAEESAKRGGVMVEIPPLG